MGLKSGYYDQYYSFLTLKTNIPKERKEGVERRGTDLKKGKSLILHCSWFLLLKATN